MGQFESSLLAQILGPKFAAQTGHITLLIL